MPELKNMDLVTLANPKFNLQSNTYRVVSLIKDTERLLQHPLATDIYLKKELTQLNSVLPTLQTPAEKCLFFCQKHKELLSHTDKADLEAICLYFVLRKDVTNKQRASVNSLCGKISAKILGQSMEQATSLILQNEILLDEFNRILFNTYKKFVVNYKLIISKNQRYSIFELTGYLMAQLDERHKGL